MNWQHVFTALAFCSGIACLISAIDGQYPRLVTWLFILATISACLAGGLAK